MKQAEKYTPVDDGLIPTGSLTHVVGTIFDLRKETRLGDVINKVLFNSVSLQDVQVSLCKCKPSNTENNQ